MFLLSSVAREEGYERQVYLGLMPSYSILLSRRKNIE